MHTKSNLHESRAGAKLPSLTWLASKHTHPASCTQSCVPAFARIMRAAAGNVSSPVVPAVCQDHCVASWHLIWLHVRHHLACMNTVRARPVNASWLVAHVRSSDCLQQRQRRQQRRQAEARRGTLQATPYPTLWPHLRPFLTPWVAGKRRASRWAAAATRSGARAAARQRPRSRRQSGCRRSQLDQGTTGKCCTRALRGRRQRTGAPPPAPRARRGRAALPATRAAWRCRCRWAGLQRAHGQERGWEAEHRRRKRVGRLGCTRLRLCMAVATWLQQLLHKHKHGTSSTTLLLTIVGVGADRLAALRLQLALVIIHEKQSILWWLQGARKGSLAGLSWY